MPWKLQRQGVRNPDQREVNQASVSSPADGVGRVCDLRVLVQRVHVDRVAAGLERRAGRGAVLVCRGRRVRQSRRTERAIQPALPVLDSEHRQFRALTDVMAAEQNTLVDEAVHVRREHLPAAAQAQRWWERNEQRRSKEQRRRRGRVGGHEVRTGRAASGGRRAPPSRSRREVATGRGAWCQRPAPRAARRSRRCAAPQRAAPPRSPAQDPRRSWSPPSCRR